MTEILLNASALKLTSCEQRFAFTVIHGLVSKELKEALDFGKALHKFAAEAAQGVAPVVAIQSALSTYSGANGAQLVLACTQRSHTLPAPYIDSNGRPLIEHYFRIPWKVMEYEGAQYQIVICGTMDHVCFDNLGVVTIIDHKTTRKYKLAEVFESYRVSVQMRFYAWAMYKFGHAITDLPLANAARDGKLCVRINAIALSQNPPRWFLGGPIYYTPAELELFEQQLTWHIEHAILPAYSNPMQTGKLNNTCDGCDFTPLCHAADENAQQLAYQQFAQRKYDPASF